MLWGPFVLPVSPNEWNTICPARVIAFSISDPFFPSASANVNRGSVSLAIGKGRGCNVPFWLSRILYAWLSDPCFTLNLVGSGVGVGSPNCGPLVGIVCEFSGSEGSEAGDGSASAGTEFFDLVRLAIRGFVVGNWPSFAYNHAPR